jgi:Ni/Co efflux regulator RcnB
MGGPGNSFIDPSSPALVRLTNVEYSQTVTDVLGESPDAAARYRFPEDPRQHGFDNNGTLLQISATHGDRYAAAAEGIAAATLASADRRALVMACEPTAAATCLPAMIRRVGRRLYRRPLTDAEVSSFTALAQGDASIVLEAMLQSPHFLYRVQVGVSDAKRPGIVGLSGFELATRLSFLLLGTTPDEALLDQAGTGALDTSDGAAKVVKAMLADPRARRGFKRFYEQWLALTTISGPSAEAGRIPHAGDKALAADLVEETRRFVDDVVWDSGATVPDLLTAKYTFVNANLAKLYGLAAPPAGQTWQRVDFAAGSPRAGLLTQGSLMAAGSQHDKPSSTRRGQVVREQLLCQDVPSPPPGVATNAPEAMAGESEQATFARHTTQASCAVCHKLMDPIGWGLSGFDSAGVARTKDNNGAPLNLQGRVEGMTPPEFNGPVELGQKLAASTALKACFARQLFRFVYGRAETSADEPGITELQGAFTTAGWDLGRGLAAMASSDGLRYRSKGDAP